MMIVAIVYTEQQAEAQRGSVSCPSSHSQSKQSRNWNPCLLIPNSELFLSPCELLLHRLKPKSAAAAAAKSLQSCPILCDPIDGSPPGSPIPGILQARRLEWVAISSSNA